MSVQPLEARVAMLESEVADLKRRDSLALELTRPWWARIVGVFADDPAFEEASDLGAAYRAAQRSRVLPQRKPGHVSA